MSEVTPQPEQTSEESKKRKAESSLSDLKRDQLVQARLKKQQKTQEREQEMSQLKSKLNDFELISKSNTNIVPLIPELFLLSTTAILLGASCRISSPELTSMFGFGEI